MVKKNLIPKREWEDEIQIEEKELESKREEDQIQVVEKEMNSKSEVKEQE